jgi:O-antigen/teichoic acid export membrane protein
VGIIKKQAVQSTIFIYAGVLIGFVNTGLLAPNLLETHEIGVINLLLSFSGIFASFGLLGFTTATVRFFPFFRSKAEGNRGFVPMMILTGLVGFALFLAIYYFIKPLIIASNSDKSPLLAQFFYLIVPLTFFQLFYSLFDAYNSMLYKPSLGIVLRDFLQRLLVLSGLLLLFFSLLSFYEYLWLYVAAVCIPTIILLISLIYRKEFSLKPDWTVVKQTIGWEMILVSFYGFLNSFSNLAILRIDTIMVNAYIDSSATGIYTITFFFGSLVLIPSKALNRIAPTVISDAYKVNDLETIEDIHRKSCINQFIVGMLLLLGLLINIDHVFELISESYLPGKWVIIFIAIASLIKMAGGMSDSIISYSKYFRVYTLLLVSLLCLLVLTNIIFIPQLGMTGAAVASLLSLFCFNFAKFIFLYRKFHFQPYSLRYLYIIALSAGLYAIQWFIPAAEPFYADLAIRSAFVGVVYVVIIYKLRFSQDINLLIDQTLRKLMR